MLVQMLLAFALESSHPQHCLTQTLARTHHPHSRAPSQPFIIPLDCAFTTHITTSTRHRPNLVRLWPTLAAHPLHSQTCQYFPPHSDAYQSCAAIASGDWTRAVLESQRLKIPSMACVSHSRSHIITPAITDPKTDPASSWLLGTGRPGVNHPLLAQQTDPA